MNEKTIINIIEKRKSTRSFTGETLLVKHVNDILNFLRNNNFGPFGSELKYQLIKKDSENIQVGTYGFISGAKDYMVFYAEKENPNWLDIGFVIEKFILFCTSIGVGTCWMGGTFNRKNLSKAIIESEKYFIPIVTPLGYPRDKLTIREKVLRKVAKAEDRLPLEEILVNHQNSEILNNEFYSTFLKAIQRAPSASNKQPWRIKIEGNIVHFYLKRTKGYAKIVPQVDLQKIDVGIAFCHFIEILELFNKKFQIKSGTDNKKDDIELLISCEINNN